MGWLWLKIRRVKRRRRGRGGDHSLGGEDEQLKEVERAERQLPCLDFLAPIKVPPVLLFL